MEFDDQEQEFDLREPAVVDKYKAAGEVAAVVMNKILAHIVPEKSIVELCKAADQEIEDETAKIYNKIKMDKGIAFPTCISVNNCAGHFSPLVSEDKTVLKQGDLVKIDFGVHIDGFIVQIAHSVICGQSAEVPTTGRAADAICAAYFAAECVHRLIRPGNTNKQCTEIIGKVAEVFQCKPLEGVLSHQLKRYIIDGNKTIIQRPDVDQQVEDATFEVNEVYSVDIVMSTGEGKASQREARTTIFKRQLDQNYNLKSKHARSVFSQVSKKYQSMPFNLRALGMENESKFGIVELINHDLVVGYPVLYEKDGEFVAQIKFTALVLPNSTTRLPAAPPAPFVSSSFSVDSSPDIQKVMAMSTKRNKKKAKKRAATGSVADADDDKMDTE